MNYLTHKDGKGMRMTSVVDLDKAQREQFQLMKLEMKDALRGKAVVNIQDEFIKNPYPIDIELHNNLICVPALLVDKKIATNIKGFSLMDKDKKVIETELNEKMKIALPIVAIDRNLTDNFRLNVLDRVIFNFSDNILRNQFNFGGVIFWLLDYHNLAFKVPTSSLDLLGANIPESEIENQFRIELEKLEQANNDSIRSDKA